MFGDQLIERTRALRHPLSVGLDPYLERIPEVFRRGSMKPEDPETALR
jgi:orotidine-5'-phosphate decarboxylase